MKYKLLPNSKTIQHKGHTLYRIQALENFSDVKAGDLGGWVRREWNLSQEGLCWIYDEGKVYGEARVFENAKVLGNTEISKRSWISGNSIIIDSKVSDFANYFNHLIIPSPEHPLYIIYRLKYPDLEVVFIK